ncbi:hypothetical protein QJS04_geneDACA024754 [Acorus gramineus]|uniref:F-box domain-containing protein n=1 Tax=Acorus gramineus TaxID=55184 RepID=A0AAV9A1L9_ACOGR|nr:hypothetical protein QJS04_geneDACA024754 [Acorus gramineus]
MFKKLRGRRRDEQERSVHCSVVTKSSQPHQDKKDDISNVVTESNQLLQDRKEYEINSVVTKSNQPLQNGIEYEIGSVVTKSNQPLQDGKEYEISEEITPVSHLPPTDTEVSNVVENPDAGGRELRDWCDLPDLVLFLILKWLSLSDFFAFSHVCKEWRFISKTVKREYMATQPPLVCGITSTYGFYSWKEERFYKKNQPALKGRRILGFSHGFLILLHKSDKRSFALVNPLTGVEVMANFPWFPKWINRYAHASLASPPTSPDCMFLLSDINFFCVCRPGDLKWAVY